MHIRYLNKDKPTVFISGTEAQNLYHKEIIFALKLPNSEGDVIPRVIRLTPGAVRSLDVFPLGIENDRNGSSYIITRTREDITRFVNKKIESISLDRKSSEPFGFYLQYFQPTPKAS